MKFPFNKIFKKTKMRRLCSLKYYKFEDETANEQTQSGGKPNRPNLSFLVLVPHSAFASVLSAFDMLREIWFRSIFYKINAVLYCM